MSNAVLLQVLIRTASPAYAADTFAGTAEVRTIIESAEKAKTAGNYIKAQRIYENAIAKDKNNRTLWMGLTQLHSYFGHNAEALKAVEHLMESNPNDAEALWVKSRLLNLSGEYKNALRSSSLAYDLLKNLRLNEREQIDLTANIYLSMAYSYSALGNGDKAITYYEKVLAIAPDDQIARNNLAICWQNKSQGTLNSEYDKAVEIFRTVDPEKLIEECARNSYKYSCVLKLGRELLSRLDMVTQEKKRNNPAYNARRIFPVVKQLIMQYPKERIPDVMGAFWQMSIKYVPDPAVGRILQWDNKDPGLVVADSWGDCDDMIPFANSIFSSAGIRFQNITYKVMRHTAHDICAFVNERGLWDYIDSDGTHRIAAKNIYELMHRLEIAPARKDFRLFTVRNNRKENIIDLELSE